ncbi:hypothetical protein DPMN_071095 [Dreissena polymorpha]|uniref:LRRCT domain-containing protein n=1 Tax=Dreissena polymorpha TaxID=45954 RepID=A0A9D3Z659_DREPO|nr:hypothetical protein DPMN_071095 [Dreissena polymorpha]
MLFGNPLNCDCQMRWLIATVQDKQSKLEVYGGVCSKPAHLNGRNILNITQADLNCTGMCIVVTLTKQTLPFL